MRAAIERRAIAIGCAAVAVDPRGYRLGGLNEASCSSRCSIDPISASRSVQGAFRSADVWPSCSCSFT
jgi:hypothetical protein